MECAFHRKLENYKNLGVNNKCLLILYKYFLLGKGQLESFLKSSRKNVYYTPSMCFLYFIFYIRKCKRVITEHSRLEETKHTSQVNVLGDSVLNLGKRDITGRI